MNDFKIMLNKQQQQYLQRLLPKGYSFELYKVRKNISNYPYKQFQKKYKKSQSIVLNKKQSLLPQSIDVSEKSYKERSEPVMVREQLKKIQEDLLGIVRKMRKNQSSYPFRSPVDPRALQIPDYFDVIFQPIDLKTIEDKIRRDEYEHVGEFQRDIYKMIMNSYKYNQKASTTEKKTIQFEEFFLQTMKEFRNQKHQQNGKDKQVKEEMVDEQNQQEESIQQHEGFKFKGQSPKKVEPKINPFVAIQSVTVQPKAEEKSQPQLLRILTQMASQRPRVSRKQLPKLKSVPQMSKTLPPPKPHEPQVKKQQPEEEIMQISPYLPQLTFSQQPQPSQPKDYQSEQIKDEMKSQFENETQNNKQQNFSEGYNEAASGCRIKNNEVQKQITSLLKRLSQFPLTKQKKNKLNSKFTNLDQNMTQTDKKKLFEKIIKLDENDIEYVIRILTKGKCDTNKLEEFQIDLDKAESKVLREVQNFIALRDQAFVNPNLIIETNGSPTTPLVIPAQPVSCQVIKVSKKVKKEEKKIMKKKISRKNSYDDSFSLNPPPIKKKKSQKPSKKYLKTQEQPGNGVEELLSGNEEKSQSSSYHPQPVHAQHNGKIGMNPQMTQRYSQGEKIVSNKFAGEKSSNSHSQEIKRCPGSHHKQKPAHHHHHHFNNSPYHHAAQHGNHDQEKIYDIDQFLVSSRNFQQQPQEEISSYNKLRHPNSIEQLDYLIDHNFTIGNRDKDYPYDQIREFSLDQNAKEHNDDDHFF